MSREIQRIAVDCDDVVANMKDAVRIYANTTQGYTHTPEDYLVEGEYNGYYEQIWGASEGQPLNLFSQFISSGSLARLEPVPGALETLHDLKERDFSLAIVTARSESEVDFTEEWLSIFAPDLFDEVTYIHRWITQSGEKMAKADICRELDAHCLVDDNYDHCRFMAEIGGRALLFGEYGWNQTQPLVPNMERVSDWEDVRDALLNG